MEMWMYDQIEVVLAIVGAVAALLVTAYRLGSKITHLDEATTSGLNNNAVSIMHVTEKVGDLASSVGEFKKRNHEDHETIREEIHGHREMLIEHGFKIDALNKQVLAKSKEHTRE